MSKKRILVAVMNWGLGHATRSIPVINALQNEHYEPMVASDGAALQLLKKEFPELTHLELPGYNIQFPWLLFQVFQNIYFLNYYRYKLVKYRFPNYGQSSTLLNN